MSASPIARQATQSQSIPSRHVVINDATQLPIDYSSTPGGTLYSTTPGGTRIVYDRTFLLQMRNSPLAKTPPRNLPSIPGITRGAPEQVLPKSPVRSLAKKVAAGGDEGPEQFPLEI
ncbi:eukaryotic translation initiation factor 4E-binding protein 1 isoform X2 [Neocloeon triangulifer]|uniref:eukaryotic translation initiation factor 4E-binding protein 1 isoform X2 n=1 Tax=Neocloeon triangulifer TaxID=2078957 RepID=UPI00286EB9DB|nr:eukaryotic translation initiation factor 4E-binding protein 1 isoform X2 [Neocloeon triangulifer]